MNRERVLIAVFLILTTALIVGQRFGFTWAGGTGYTTPLVATGYFPGAYATTGTFTFVRGTTVRADEKVFTLNLAGLGYVDLQPHTELTIERLAKEEVILRLGTGEITVTAGALPVEIRMDVLEATVQSGAVGFQHAPERRLARIYPGDPDNVKAGRRGEEKTAVTEPSILFYDRADREPAEPTR